MTTPEDGALIERLARAAATNKITARRFLAMMRAYEAAMKERHEAWLSEMVETAPKQTRDALAEKGEGDD